jgi:DNA-binding CsgD family transcriptional regulator
MEYRPKLAPSLMQVLEASEQLGKTTSRDLACHLFRSPRTIDKQWELIRDCLGVNTRFEAVHEARKLGLL